MNREIRFRVWCKHFKEWEKDEIFISQSGDIYHLSKSSGFLIVRPDTHIVERYTGLRDKNGKEIYEGDIIKIIDVKFSSRPSPTIIKVEYNNEYAGFCIGGSLVESMEILGNIHENPELLNE